MADFYTLLTSAGIAYETACKAAGQPIKLKQMSVGDGNGAIYNPDAAATSLRREVWRGDLNSLIQDANNSSWLLAEITIPDNVGGWYVREAGIWTDTGVLYAIVKYPESYKPVLASSGSGKEFYLRSIFQTSNASIVTLVIDDTIVKATRAWVTDYVAAELAKLDSKQSVRAATTANIVLSGAQTIDGVAVVAGDRVLVKNQTLAKDNGLYIAANGAWPRALDADTSAEVTSALLVSVEQGATLADTSWQLVTDGPITLGTTALTFEMLAGRTGIEAGTYKSLTVDKYGRATGGTNPDTLAGYGIGIPTQAEAEAQADQDNAKPMTALRVFQAIAKRVTQATEAAFGWAKVATQAQTNSGVDDSTFLTPKKFSAGLAALVIQATEAVAGIAKVATQAQTNSGVDDSTFLTPKKFSAGLAALVIQATEAVAGIAKVATQAQTNAGTDDATIVTPKKMRLGVSISLADNGSIVFPKWLGGLIIQWGQINVGDVSSNAPVSYSLPLAFPNAHYQTLLSCQENAAGNWNVYLLTKGLLGFQWAALEWSAVVQNAKVTYFSIGS
jgi:hypothetical protein